MTDCKLKYYTNTSADFSNTYSHLQRGFKTLLPPAKDTQQFVTLTGCNIRNSYSYLPYLTGTPYKGAISHGDTCIESSLFMPGLSSNDKKKTSFKSDGQFYDKHFYIFNGTTELPNAMMSVETKDKGFVNGRSGVSTRF